MRAVKVVTETGMDSTPSTDVIESLFVSVAEFRLQQKENQPNIVLMHAEKDHPVNVTSYCDSERPNHTKT